MHSYDCVDLSLESRQLRRLMTLRIFTVKSLCYIKRLMTLQRKVDLVSFLYLLAATIMSTVEHASLLLIWNHDNACTATIVLNCPSSFDSCDDWWLCTSLLWNHCDVRCKQLLMAMLNCIYVWGATNCRNFCRVIKCWNCWAFSSKSTTNWTVALSIFGF